MYKPIQIWTENIYFLFWLIMTNRKLSTCSLKWELKDGTRCCISTRYNLFCLVKFKNYVSTELLFTGRWSESCKVTIQDFILWGHMKQTDIGNCYDNMNTTHLYGRKIIMDRTFSVFHWSVFKQAINNDAGTALWILNWRDIFEQTRIT